MSDILNFIILGGTGAFLIVLFKNPNNIMDKAYQKISSKFKRSTDD